jgi:hypothetical protein
MADDEAIFVGVWSEKWAKIGVPQQFASTGTVRRLHIATLLGKTMPNGIEAGDKLIEGIFADLKSVLKEGAVFWSPAPGLIDIFYPKMLPQAADLSHSVVRSTIERRIRETIIDPARAEAATQASDRRITPEQFQMVLARAKAKPDHVQVIDASELILGKSDPKAHLSRRAWRVIDEIVDEFLGASGYCARQPDNKILLFFPGLSISLAKLKRNAIAADIERSAGVIERENQAGDSDAGGLPATTLAADAPSPKQLAEDAREIAQLNRAFASLASASVIAGPTTLPEGIRFQIVPVWRAGNQTLVGHSIMTSAEGDSAGIPQNLLDMACLIKAQTDVQDALAAKSPYLVLGRVHWQTLERVTFRTRYLELAASLPEEARRYLVLALYDVPDDLLTARIEERLRELGRFCRSVSCRVDLGRRDFEQLKGQNLHPIGAELPADDLQLPESQIMASMNGFLDALAGLQTKTFIDGLQTKSLVIAALAAGFDYLSGSAIADSQTGAQGVRAFSIADLYADSSGG